MKVLQAVEHVLATFACEATERNKDWVDPISQKSGKNRHTL